MATEETVEFIKRCFISTYATIVNELATTRLAHWNESVFRYFFVKTFLASTNLYHLDTEWHRVDLHITNGNEHHFIEFKFYLNQSISNSNGVGFHYKGWAGKKNFEEFKKCINDLRNISDRFQEIEVSSRFIVLAYELNDHQAKEERKFRYWYGDNLNLNLDLADNKSLEMVNEFTVNSLNENRSLVFKLFKVNP